MKQVRIRGARVHNLKNVSVEFPRGALVVVTGPSGSGKSSLAFDVVYAEGQRRFVESLSAYARQFLPRLPKPDVDSIEGLSPTMCVRQERPNHNPRSTVGTVTEVLDFLRLLFAKVGTPHSPATGLPLTRSTTDDMVGRILELGEGRRATLLAPLGSAQGKLTQREAVAALSRLEKSGFVRVRVDGTVLEMDAARAAIKKGKHRVDVVIDRVVARADRRERIADSVELAVQTGGGRMLVVDEAGAELWLTDKFECPASGFVMPPLEPRFFSFNSPEGACGRCGGLGVERGDAATLDAPHNKEDDADAFEVTLRDAPPCTACGGSRLRPEALLVKVRGRTLAEVTEAPISELGAFVRDALDGFRASGVAKPILRELDARVNCLLEVGLEYLSLARPTSTLSGGEAQRVQLATQIGANLSGVLYVLDEPSIGLHATDTAKLLRTLATLRDRDNTVLVVEHDTMVIEHADHVIDLGPGAGEEGGEVVFEGPPARLAEAPRSGTAAYFSGAEPLVRRQPKREFTRWITVRGATRNNLRGLEVALPVGALVVVTGVSGSGKSSLVMDTLLAGAEAHLRGEPLPRGVDHIEGLDAFERVVSVDAAPIGRSARSCPATYAGVLGPIRELFAATPEAKTRGYDASRFSFNVKGGRCEVCQGSGVMRVQMHFLPDAEVVCDACEGRRYNRETLEIRFRGRSIAEVLAMPVREAAELFAPVPDLHRILGVMRDVGLGYLRLGQSATTLSGGEAQRLKLAVELARKGAQPTLYVFDEPTTGLHFRDVGLLLGVFERLRDAGHTLIIVEHHLDVVASADHVVELGPGGGAAGGHLVAEGRPEAVARTKGSPTAPFLAAVLKTSAQR